MKNIFTLVLGLVCIFHTAGAQVPYQITREYCAPVKIVSSTGVISKPELILSLGNGQALLGTKNCCKVSGLNGENASLLLDFGREMHGGIRIVTGQYKGNGNKPVKVRIRFGESVSEACCNIDEAGATNDHGIRDFEALLPWLGMREFGQTGFRFVRIDFLEPNVELMLKEVNAYFEHLDIPVVGSFKCSDDRLNQIWATGAYTVQNNIQTYVWDGIKRDRLVWIGDMHPEIMTINTVFGDNPSVRRSLDFIRDATPVPGWMNNIGSYSIWWLLIHREWYLYQGDLQYLMEQKEYMTALLNQLIACIDEKGVEIMPQKRFLDHQSEADDEAKHVGLQGLMVSAMTAGQQLANWMGDAELSAKCAAAKKKLKEGSPEIEKLYYASKVPHTEPGRKQAISMLSMAGVTNAAKAAECILDGGAHGFSTFYGYYMLNTLSNAGKYKEALDIIKSYWGGMLDLGATTFWEDFDLDWLENAGRIDEIPVPGKVDVHRTYGKYCYVGYRHSFCHGWASGPTSWLTANILGIRPLEPGCKTLLIEPHLSGLEWVEGTFPTPLGPVSVRVEKNGKKQNISVDAPKGIKIIKKS